MAEDPIHLPPNVRPISFLMDLEAGISRPVIANLAEACKTPNSAVIMDADYGGQVLLTCPVSRIACDETTLHLLHRDLADLSGFEDEGLYYEYAPPGTPVPGGMGGGVVVNEPWIHK